MIASTLPVLLRRFCAHSGWRRRSWRQQTKLVCVFDLYDSMEGAFTPAALFNAATISLHIPTRPLSPNAAPPATTLSAPLSPEQANATDEWVTQLSTASEREEAYYGELPRSFPVAIAFSTPICIRR